MQVGPAATTPEQPPTFTLDTKVPLVSLLPTTSKWVLPSSAPDGAESDTVPSGKAGLGVALSDSLGAYGEVSFIGSGDADVDRGYGTKIGLKYSF